MEKKEKTVSSKDSFEDEELFEQAKLEDTKVVKFSPENLEKYDNVILEDLISQCANTTNKKIRAELKKKIKQIKKRKSSKK